MVQALSMVRGVEKLILGEVIVGGIVGKRREDGEGRIG